MELFSIGFIGLFSASFLSATILPMSSEGILLLMLSQQYDPVSCLIIATIGNSLGGLTNYGLGMFGNALWFKRFGIKEEKLMTFQKRIQKRGYLVAFFSWVPFIGDPMTVALGFFKVPFIPVLFFIVLGKLLRYLVFVLPFL
jgi:membrane protein YqaA with SNARE-associated domain